MSSDSRNFTLLRLKSSQRGHFFGFFSGSSVSISSQYSMLPGVLKAILSRSPASSQRLPHLSHMS